VARPQQWRVDALTLVGEVDTTRDPNGGWTWNSADRRALRIVGELDVRLPTAADLLAPALGHRLAGTQDVEVSALPPRRVAGRSADGVRLVPRDPARTTVRSVDLWADVPTGLPLRVEVSAAGEDEPVLTSVLLDLELEAPPTELTDFPRPRNADVTVGDAPDVAVLADRFAPYLLPDELAGLPRRPRSPLSTGDATLRTVLAVLYVGWSVLGVAAVALFLSTLTDSPLAAALGAIALLVTSGVLVGLEASASVQPYLPTRYWLAFVDLFRDPVLYRDVLRGTALQAVYIAVFLTAAWANLMTKDVTS
jgi:hypothetical protein